MKAWERWTFGLLALVVLLTGGVYFWMKYLLVNDDPFAVVNHPWQPAMLAAHVLAAPGLLLMFGVLLNSHILGKLGASYTANRKSGFVSLGSFFVMAASGYLLQVVTADAALRLTVVVHVASGVLFGVTYLAHLIISVRLPVAVQDVTRVGVVIAAICLVGAGHLFENPANPGLVIEREAYLMGTRARLVTWDATRVAGLQRLERALEALEQTEAELSTWREDSRITALNRTPIGIPWQSSPHVCAVFDVVSDWQRATGGAFDPAIGRILDRWGIHGRGQIPSTQELAVARSTSGFHHVEFNPARCTVTRRADVTIDVGAFGKGEALDRAELVLGDRPWLIDLGGHVSVHGAPPGESGWSVAMAHPLDRRRPHIEVRMREGSLSTSAGSERDLLVSGRQIGHILDPRTGQPAAFRGSVSVWHRRGLVADILSTALFVMGPAEGLRWAEARGVSACYLVPDDAGRVSTAMTPAFRKAVLFSEE